MKVLVLGAGKMVEAILLGLKGSEDLSQWCIYTPSQTRARELAAKVGARFISELPSDAPDWVLLGFKPQQLVFVEKDLKGKYPGSLYLSLLAAVDESVQREILGVHRLVRIMPNLQVKVHEGVTLLSSTSAVDDLPAVKDRFSKLGTAIVLNEKELEELTLLTGSGPALFYEFTKTLARSFNSLDEKTRELLARQVLKGSGVAATLENESLDKMIDAVTSKGGVTIAVLEKWRGAGLSTLLKEGVEEGLRRTEEIKSTLRN